MNFKWARFKERSNSSGLSMIEIMISGLLISGVALGIAVATKGLHKFERKRDQNFSGFESVINFNKILENGESCKKNFEGKNLSNGSLDKIVYKSGTPLYTTGDVIGQGTNGSITFQSVNWTAPTPLGVYSNNDGSIYNYSSIQPVFTFKRGGIDPTPSYLTYKTSIFVTHTYPSGTTIVDCNQNMNIPTPLQVNPQSTCDSSGVQGYSVDTSGKLVTNCSPSGCVNYLSATVPLYTNLKDFNAITNPSGTPGILCPGTYEVVEFSCLVQTWGGCGGDSCGWWFSAQNASTGLGLSSGWYHDGCQESWGNFCEYSWSNAYLTLSQFNTNSMYNIKIYYGVESGVSHYCKLTVDKQ